MRTKITLLLAIFFAAISFAQNSETEKPQTNSEKVTASEPEPMPFKFADVPPLAPDCKAKWKVEKQQKCTQIFISSHVNRKFNTELVSELGLTGRIKIDVTFTIDKEGKPKNISATGGPEIMNQHAVEVIKLLPQFQPALQEGKPIEVSYHLPVMFDIL